ncbi:MAG: DNA polymerase III subunit delta' [Rubrivivax sp.]|uniref:DNA polymerase III subunit delta' n=1 Tax=Ottowia sp. TaxID=1898956 RepID=UPI00217AACD6|nr:DNA polymerase III subunit delta' [Ottowia sp.]MCC6812571.1 DNA polymerase III subunit delta' [Rubrivivax sp.]MCZ2089315.1 DNA polymerase III subunit delta' [Burkholderiales bacterium]HNE59417.1 DNA polymerase III subunit delta' [Ottowia sp.]HNO41270.1 DNA polymerase III subunit delta' [Ottowia sp.]HNR83669.1 DNA polymerase III subunit delta' [Ottowia sp.]
MSGAALAPWIARQHATLRAQRGHAWLLQGPSGLGQFELALALVRAWLCDQPTPDGACGLCPSCHGIDVHTHPDLVVLMPETEMLARGWPLPEKAQAEIDDKKRKPSREIRVDAMREAIEFAQRTSGRGRGKAVLVYPAERMNAVTANALLKTLEEPPGDARFVLATDAAHLLLPTIRSRCLSHTLAWPPADEALAWLATQGLAGPQAAALLQAAGGRPAEALALAEGKDSARRWSQLAPALARGDVAALADLPLPEAVARLQKLCHDLLALQVGAAPRFFAPADLPRQPLSLLALTRWWQQLAQSARTAEHPLNAGLATEFLVSSARQALNSGR